MKHIVTTLCICLTFASFVSCGKNEPLKQQQSSGTNTQMEAKKDSVIEQPITIDTFSAFPPEINGCSCYFSANENEFKNSIYLYADDYENTSFVRINGMMTTFKLKDSKEVSEKHVIKKYDNNNFELIIDIQQVGQLDETWQQKGTLTLIKKGGKTITKNIYGECGC
jgi:hypothetical protein